MKSVITVGIDCSNNIELIFVLFIVKFLGEKKKRKKGGQWFLLLVLNDCISFISNPPPIPQIQKVKGLYFSGI